MSDTPLSVVRYRHYVLTSGRVGSMNGRLGAYLLPGDPVWLRSSLARYYDRLDDLVVLVPDSGLGWLGRPLPIEECLAAVADVDVRRLARIVRGDWVNTTNPMAADTAQRQAGLDSLAGTCDWVIQLDNDEVIPDFGDLTKTLDRVNEDVQAVEWPMRVLYRHLAATRFLAVSGWENEPVYEYPGPIAVRPWLRLADARRPAPGQGAVLRLAVRHDHSSLQLERPDTEIQVEAMLEHRQTILHNSWGRSPHSVWRKVRSWGHAAGWRSVLYYVLRWLPSSHTWRFMRDFHPFAQGLWPRLAPIEVPTAFMHPFDASEMGVNP